MALKLLVFDSHPVQYRVPVWKYIEKENFGSTHVVYASDCSVKGFKDEGFGLKFAWDEPMLEGYSNTILNCEKGKPLSGWRSLTGKGVKGVIKRLKPKVILLTGLNYQYDLVVVFFALFYGIPLWLRCETQDEAVERSKAKSVLRYLIYRIAYSPFNRIFFIGELNRQHYLRHGVPKSKLRPARYGTVDRFGQFEINKKIDLRTRARLKAGVSEIDFVVGFSGKLIPKKNPGILYQMLESLPEWLRSRTYLYFMGSGELEVFLQQQAKIALQKFGVRSYFAGFVNQTEIASHYLAMDVLVLPSQRMGETWGLVANEAMQAGCAVVVSDAVGCQADFHAWERFKVFKEGDAVELAKHINSLNALPRNFDWAIQLLNSYTIEATANAFIKELKKM